MKLSKHAWTIWGILLVVALVLMVLIPFSRTASWWIAAGCTVLMFLLAAWTFYAAFRKDGLESKILGWPIFKVGAVALAVQAVLGFALMGLAALCPAWVTVLAEVLIFAVMYFFMIRPQNKKQKEIANFRKSLQVNQSVITAGGIHGTIKEITDDYIVLEIASNVKIKIDKNSIFADASATGNQSK